MLRSLRFKSLPSTQTRARALAEAGARAWTVVRADRQTHGRGRMDRSFSSGNGGLYFTVILRPRLRPTGLARFSLRTGRLLSKTLSALSGEKTKVKPPNDVLALCPDGRWRKICGILIEASGGQKSLDWVLVGIGINLNNRLPASLPEAASLRSISCGKIGKEKFYREILKTLRKSWGTDYRTGPRNRLVAQGSRTETVAGVALSR